MATTGLCSDCGSALPWHLRGCKRLDGLTSARKSEWLKPSPLPTEPPPPLDNGGVTAASPTTATPSAKAGDSVTLHERDAQEDARRLAIVTAPATTKPPRQFPWKTDGGPLSIPRIRNLMAEGKGYRAVALILSGELGRPVSHMAVKRALERAGITHKSPPTKARAAAARAAAKKGKGLPVLDGQIWNEMPLIKRTP